MGSPSGETQQSESRARLLLLYAETAKAATLVELLSPHFELVSCPVSALTERWVDELQPDLVLLSPPAEQKKLLATCQAVRAQTDCSLVVLSERDEELVIARALSAGADEYLVLPMGGRELAARTEALLRRVHRSTGLAETRRVGSMTLSAADHSVEMDGRRIFLSPIEFRLLACLASSPGKVLTHQTLMSRVWGAEYVDSRHYLRLYVRYLREKLEEDPTNPKLIVSEWGVGYKLQLPEPEVRPAETPELIRRVPSFGVA